MIPNNKPEDGAFSKDKKQPCTASASVIKRLPKYFRYLRALLNNDILRVSSGELARLMGTSSSQIRQDLNCFGDFGQQGYGYNVKYLYTQISRILGVGRKFNAVIVSESEVPPYLADKSLFETRGIRIRGVFSASSVGQGLRSYVEFSQFCKKENIDIAVMCVPETAAQRTAEQIASCGVRGIWNFSHGEIKAPEGVEVQNVLYGDSLMLLMYDINKKE